MGQLKRCENCIKMVLQFWPYSLTHYHTPIPPHTHTHTHIVADLTSYSNEKDCGILESQKQRLSENIFRVQFCTKIPY